MTTPQEPNKADLTTLDDSQTDLIYDPNRESSPPVDLTLMTAKRVQALYSSYFAWLQQQHDETDVDYLIAAAVELVKVHVESQGY
jgi:hypothetical protein